MLKCLIFNSNVQSYKLKLRLTLVFCFVCMRLGHGTGDSLLNGSLKDQQMNQLFDWSYFYSRGVWQHWGVYPDVGRVAAFSKDSCHYSQLLSNQKQQSLTVVVLLSVQKLVPLTEFPSFNEAQKWPTTESSTVIFPIIHVKNKAGVCVVVSLRLKWRMKIVTKQKSAQKENSTFGLSTFLLPLLQAQQWLVRDS